MEATLLPVTTLHHTDITNVATTAAEILACVALLQWQLSPVLSSRLQIVMVPAETAVAVVIATDRNGKNKGSGYLLTSQPFPLGALAEG